MPILFEDTDQAIQIQRLQIEPISRSKFAAATVIVPIIATVAGAYLMDRLPRQGLSHTENKERTKEFAGFLLADMAISAVAVIALG